MQFGNVFHSPFSGFHLIAQIVKFLDCRITGSFQFSEVCQSVFLQVNDRPCHLLEIENFRPPLKSRRVNLLHFRLNVNQQIGLAEQYGALKTSAGSAGISEKLSNMLNSSFDPFMDRLMDSLDALIDQNRGWVAEKPWMSGTIRTNYIDRESVYRSFQNAIFKA